MLNHAKSWKTSGVILSLTSMILTLAACSPAATPTPTPTPVPPPTATPLPMPTPIGFYMPSYMPICDGAKLLAEDFGFTWPGIENIKKDAENLEYYRCQQPYGQVATFYREKMLNPPYNWQEIAWVELPEGTLGEYFHAVYQSWFYLWFVPDQSAGQASYLVAAWRQGEVPLDLPCH
jgi:hypothetical protein